MKKKTNRGLAVFGSNGFIGSRYLNAVSQARPLSRARGLHEQLEEGHWDVFFLNGLTNPSLEKNSLIDANFEFPVRTIISAAEKKDANRFRFFTIGTVHEAFDSIVQNNSYVSSKRRLSDHLLKMNCDHFHLRLHTAFGGDQPPPAHLFLGQIWRAISTVTPFSMSSGRAIREYHHVDDLVSAFESIRAIADSKSHSLSRVIELSHGQSVSLREIATGIFGSLGCENLLKIGALADRAGDNWDSHFEPSPEVIYPSVRPTIPALVEYFRDLMQG